MNKQINAQTDQPRLPDDSGAQPVELSHIPLYQEGISHARIALEAALSMGLANSPMAGMSIRTVSGNFVVARPRGIINGRDFGHAGQIRRIDTEAIKHQLEHDSIVILSPLAYSRTGEVFILDAPELAAQTAVTLKADKLIWLSSHAPVSQQQTVNRQLNVREAGKLNLDEAEAQTVLKHAIHACERGIRRVHLLQWQQDGSLLRELFTRDGTGTMITGDNYDNIRQASIDDVGGILELIEPLEQSGMLVRRSREHLEMEITHFTVMERDGAIVACSALYPYPDNQSAELACVAVHPDYQHQGRGEHLLQLMEDCARRQNIQQIFLLTTQASHWFQEHGFVNGSLDDLPGERKSLYNFQRKSAVLIKKIPD